MTVFRRLLTETRGLRLSGLSRPRRGAEKSVVRSHVPRLETLESLELLSHASLPLHAAVAKPAKAVPVEIASVPFASIKAGSVAAASVSEESALFTQTVTVPNTLTNFNQPFAPPALLFNPAVGQLVAVTVTETAGLSSQIVSQNLSATAPATITATLSGTFSITGASPTGAAFTGPLTASTPPATVTVNSGDPNFGGTSTADFGTLVDSQTQTFTYTSPSDLAFFTASATRGTIAPTLVENAEAGASAPNGNLQTMVSTQGSGSISIVYTYAKALPAVINLVRFGIHHQPTVLYVTFAGPLDPVSANNPAFYSVIAPNAHGSFTGHGTKTIRITTATYNPADFTVRLTPATQLNFHKFYQLKITLPGTNGTPVVIEFGGLNSLGGFTNHQGQTVLV